MFPFKTPTAGWAERLDSGPYSRVYTGLVRFMDRGFQIGSAAKATGLSIDAIRFYQKSGLLRPPARTTGGYRVFTETEIAQLQFIARAQDLGFSLAEIRELLSLRNENGRACPEVRGLIHRKLQNVREKIASLRQLESELARGLGSCDRALKRSAARERGCPVIEEIATGKTRRKP
jgi:MerR family mercuric resistance operon transcriptional regulator